MPQPSRNKAYQNARNWLVLANLVVTLAMLLGALGLGLTDTFYDWAVRFVSARSVILFLYFLFFSVYTVLVSFPLSLYSGFLLEHRYQLSNQGFRSWLWEWTKKQLLSFGLTAPIVLILYGLIWNFERSWWILAWAGYAVFTLVLGKLFPVLIIPLFYKYSPVGDETLKRRIESLAKRYGFAVEHVFSLNLSKTTKKANAMFTGFGKTRRVILGDTLLNSFSHDEIETVVGHELGHCKHRDIWKQFAFGMVLSFFGFWLAYQWFGQAADQLGYGGAADVRAFPLLCLFFFLFGLVMSPLTCAFSRRAERRADLFALKSTGRREAFISALRKLGEMNLADLDPHPLIEFLLYDHPAIGKRIKEAQNYTTQLRSI